jgi:hypothetical protein
VNNKIQQKLEELIQIVREETLAEFVAALGHRAPSLTCSRKTSPQ